MARISALGKAKANIASSSSSANSAARHYSLPYSRETRNAGNKNARLLTPGRRLRRHRLHKNLTRMSALPFLLLIPHFRDSPDWRICETLGPTRRGNETRILACSPHTHRRLSDPCVHGRVHSPSSSLLPEAHTIAPNTDRHTNTFTGRDRGGEDNDIP